MRGWSNESTKEVSQRVKGTCSKDGARTLGRVRFRVAGDAVDRREFGMTTETLRSWVRQHQRDEGLRPGLTTTERERLKQLERENRELKRANEILKSAAAFFGAEFDRRQKR